MLSKESIQKIQDDAVAMAFNAEAVNEEMPVVALTDGVKLQNIEYLMPAPQRFKGQFKTGHIQEFVRYANDQTNASVFVNQDTMQAFAHFDFGTPAMPAHRDHTSILTLKQTPEYKKLLQLDSDTLNQRGLVELLEDYHANITPLAKEDIPGNDAPAIDLVKAITAVRNTKVKNESETSSKIEDLSEERSVFGKTEIKNEAGAMPAYLDWTCTPYTGLKLPLQANGQNDDENEERTFRIRISSITDGDTVRFTLRIIQLDEHKQIMAKAFKDQLETDLNNEFSVRIGDWV